MNELYIVAIVVVVCSLWLYMSLKGKIEQMGKSVANKPQPAPQVVSSYPGAPQVSVSGPMASGDEVAAVVMAAIAAYESDIAGSPVATLSAAGGAIVSSLVPDVKVQKYRRRDSLWVATARYESHKRL